MREKQRQRGGGFTLAEVLLASAILAVMVTAVTQAIVAGQAQSYNALHEQRALALGDAMMEEVLSHPITDPSRDARFGPDTAEDAANRSAFDAVDDFADYDEAAGELRDAAGQLYPALYQCFERTVEVASQSLTVAAFEQPQDCLRVRVTVAEPGGRRWIVERLVPRSGS